MFLLACSERGQILVREYPGDQVWPVLRSNIVKFVKFVGILVGKLIHNIIETSTYVSKHEFCRTNKKGESTLVLILIAIGFCSYQ